MSYLIVDLETSTYESCRRKANPFDPRNKIVLLALCSEQHVPYVGKWSNSAFLAKIQGVNLLIGHNIKFDLLHIIQQLGTSWLKDIKIYDTMLAEYLLTGQEAKFASLNKLSEKYGGTQKDDRIKEYWENGIQTEDIPEDILTEYAMYDVLNTHTIYQCQQKEVLRLHLDNLVNSNMEDLLATTLIEHHGMKIDQTKAQQMIEQLGEPNYERIHHYIPSDFPISFNWQSNDHLSALLFGGSIKYVAKEPNGTFKTGARAGQPKFKNVDKEYKFPRMVEFSLKTATKKDGVYKVDDETLTSLKTKSKDLDIICSHIIDQRDKAKQIKTYYEPMTELSQHGGLLHAELVHVQTNTGRLSSRNPNIQNWSKGANSDIKSCVVSRWGDEGAIVEMDASQLEIVCQALLAQDERMIEEIKKGTDFHCLRLAAKKKMPYEEVYHLCKVKNDPAWDYERSMTKAFSFQRAYGAGPVKIAASTGLSEEEVKQLIEAEDKLFPMVKLFNDTNISEVNRTAHVINNESHKKGILQSLTGRRYVFFDEESPEWLAKKGIARTFSPTQIKNYPIQGFGAEVMAELRGYLARRLIGREDRIVMINTVHDSILFDVKKDIISQFVPWLLKESKAVDVLLTKRYNLKINVPFGFDIKVGTNWKEMVEYKEV